MSLRNLKRLNSKGDTIVEVMIVLTILGLAIGISYATANSSLKDISQAEEHAQATELAQSQIEGLRTLLAPGSPNIFITGPFCLVPSGSTYAIAPTSPTLWPGGTYPSGCQMSGNTPYTIKVSDLSVANPALPPDTFEIIIQWPDIHGQGTDTVTLGYQLHTTP
jgi:type II secretory pathway pseudopilin PulG